MHENELIAQVRNDFPNDVANQEMNDPEYFGVLEACEVYYMNGCYDDIGGNVEAPTGHYYRIYRWIVTTDNFGFNELFTFDTEEEAEGAVKLLDKQLEEWDA